MSKVIQKVQSFREQNRTSALFNHLSAVSESVPGLGWVAMVRRGGGSLDCVCVCDCCKHQLPLLSNSFLAGSNRTFLLYSLHMKDSHSCLINAYKSSRVVSFSLLLCLFFSMLSNACLCLRLQNQAPTLKTCRMLPCSIPTVCSRNTRRSKNPLNRTCKHLVFDPSLPVT